MKGLYLDGSVYWSTAIKNNFSQVPKDYFCNFWHKYLLNTEIILLSRFGVDVDIEMRHTFGRLILPISRLQCMLLNGYHIKIGPKDQLRYTWIYTSTFLKHKSLQLRCCWLSDLMTSLLCWLGDMSLERRWDIIQWNLIPQTLFAYFFPSENKP